MLDTSNTATIAKAIASLTTARRAVREISKQLAAAAGALGLTPDELEPHGIAADPCKPDKIAAMLRAAGVQHDVLARCVVELGIGAPPPAAPAPLSDVDVLDRALSIVRLYPARELGTLDDELQAFRNTLHAEVGSAPALTVYDVIGGGR